MGPFPDATHPAWQWQLIVARDSLDPTTFDYFLEAATTATPDTWIKFVTGSFDPWAAPARGAEA